MKNFIKKYIYRIAYAVCFICFIRSGAGQDFPLSSSLIRVGTLRLTPSSVIFRCDGTDEIFDLSAKAYLSASGVDFPGVPGLREVGFTTILGKTYLFGKKPKSIFILDLAKVEPNDKINEVLYECVNGAMLNVKSNGETPVIRVDLEIFIPEQGKRKTTLWKRLPSDNIDK